MKIMRILALIVFSCTLIAGCKLADKDKADKTFNLQVEISGIAEFDSFNSRTGVGINSVFDSQVDKVFVKAFQQDTRIHLPQGGVAGSVLQLTRNTSKNKWEGVVVLTNPEPSGTVVFLAYAVAANGRHLYSGTVTKTNIQNDPGLPFEIPVTGSNLGTTAAYELGGWGPGGGFIFNVRASYTTSGYTPSWRYMEVAPLSWNGNGENSAQWGLYGTYIGGTFVNTGKGAENTAVLVNFANDHSLSGTAAQQCYDSNFNASNDWVLPSINELILMQSNLIDNDWGDLSASGKYWSSSEYDAEMGSIYDFNVPLSITNNKNYSFYFRPVRIF